MPAHLPPVLFLMGPTCSGKTALAVELVRRQPQLAIINVDSALVYEGLEIGAARPEPEVLAMAPHRLLGFRDPAMPYSAADFREDALREIRALHAEGRIPLLVGGTMLYFRALLQGLAELPAADAAVRAQLDARAAAEGWPALHAWLAQVDPEAAARLKPNDQQRVQRALEVYLLTGEPLSAHHARQQGREGGGIGGGPAFPYNVTQFALMPGDRALLHARIEVRFRTMLNQGLLEEVRRLHARGDLHPGLPAIRAVGYRQVWGYLDGEYDEAEMVRRAIVATRQLAKRQLTWLRGWPGLIPLEASHSLESLSESVFSSLQEPFYPDA
ncbi:tRNA (adenosine(37)-N6)-dimethylallyltransferase MiaA [Isoalcanivorax indicus]|uniref:tRNA (adenosine(37)-N6)-dimethylallyltransferase MiaA n=1 Tax=Isoalcanivorax indicus TaxID=2202653 RepID=UPI000DBA76DE|nr:tRNA (adenosine(37)-N6)-dimethylallyltransferase MiaA [Isoalcanivorax indicus]